MRLRESKKVVHGDTAGDWQTWNRNPNLIDPKSEHLVTHGICSSISIVTIAETLILLV